MNWKVISVPVIMLLMLFTYGCIGSSKDTKEITDTIEEDYAWHYRIDSEEGDTIKVHVKVIDGGPIDVYILDSDNFARYLYALGGGTTDIDLIYLDEKYNTKEYTGEVTVDKSGAYYLVLDNTYIGYTNENGEEEASPEGSVVVDVNISIE